MPVPNASDEAPSVLSLKGGMTAHALLQMAEEADLETACRQLDALMADDPDGLRFTPCILAFPGRDALPDWLPDWVAYLKHQSVVPFAVQCSGADNQARVNNLGLADLPKPEPSFRRPRATATPVRQCQVIRQQVRSGQQIYARDADLIILASVSAGAEVMADYDIHVYGELRGRALAGVQGHSHAQIVCATLDAELVAIAGVYMLPEQFPDTRDRVHISLDNDQLVMSGNTASPTARHRTAGRG